MQGVQYCPKYYRPILILVIAGSRKSQAYSKLNRHEQDKTICSMYCVENFKRATTKYRKYDSFTWFDLSSPGLAQQQLVITCSASLSMSQPPELSMSMSIDMSLSIAMGVSMRLNHQE